MKSIDWQRLKIVSTALWMLPNAFFALVLISSPVFCSAQSNYAHHAITPAQIYERAHSSIVVILTADGEGNPLSQGSGFIVAKDKIVTNHHVLKDASGALIVFADGMSSKADGIVADSGANDLTILSVKTGSRLPLQIANELDIHQGDPVYAIGAPRGLELSITNGIVSGFRRLDEQFLIQTTASIASGSSGGPLLNGDGNVIGVTTLFMTDSPGIYFSVGAGDVSRLIRAPDLLVVPFSSLLKSTAIVPKSATSNGHQSKEDGRTHGQLEGTYTGKVHNISANLESNFSIFIKQSKELVYGCMIVQPPLYGSGSLTGSINQDKLVFDVDGPQYHISFEGSAAGNNISGTYVVTRPARQNGYFELKRTSSEVPSSVQDPTKCLGAS
jgi:S1-C subfamily serine protease